jgi:hypothetical protein
MYLLLRNALRQTIRMAVACLLALMLLGPTVSATTETSHPDDLLQFTSGGHILGFTADGVYAASGGHAYRVQFVNAATAPVADTPPAEGGGGVPALSRVTYPNLWPGISLAYDAPDGTLLRSTYRLEAHADPAHIRLRYNVPVELERGGSLTLRYAAGLMRESAPVAWQEIDGQRLLVAVSFRLIAPEPTVDHEPVLSASGRSTIQSQQVGFSLGDYDPAYPLTIDPSLTWHTFLGGSGNDGSYSIAVDGSGNVYVAGDSNAAWGSPVRGYSGDYDAFAAKLDSSGALQWHTFLGGSGIDFGYSIALDGSGNVYVAGASTPSWGSPVRAHSGGYFDAFAAKLDSSGALGWHTFLGGSGSDTSYSIAVDGSGDVYVTGLSDAAWGSPIRAYSDDYDAFVARLDSSGVLQWHTFLGGGGTDYGFGIVVGGSENVYVVGRSYGTWGSPVRGYSGDYDAFAAQLDGSGALGWHTFLGGSEYDLGHSIAVDGSGNVYVAGDSSATWGSPIRAHSGGYLDAFTAQLGSGGVLQWHTFLGGSGSDYGRGIAVDGSGNVYVTGTSDAAWGAPVRGYSGGQDAFGAQLDSSGALQWHTFLGQSLNDYGGGIVVDGGGNVYVAGTSQATWGAPVRTHSGDYDAFAAKLSSAPEIDVQGNSQSIANGSTTPSAANHTDFGTTAVSGGAVVRTFTIRNSGDADLNLTGSLAVTLTTGAHFSVTVQPSSPVISNSTTAFDITFAPWAAGSFTDTVHIPNDDSDENPYTFVISGAGTADTLTTIIGDAPDPSAVGQAYTVTVSVSSAEGTPTGVVDVDDGGGNGCSITLSGGTGGCSLTSTHAGTKTLTASFNGTVYFGASSDVEVHTVNGTFCYLPLILKNAAP